MPEIPSVSVGDVADADYHNDLRDRTLQRYADAADRDAKTPTPVAGDMAYLTDIDATQVFDGVSWSTLAVGADYLPLAGGDMTGAVKLTTDSRVENPGFTRFHINATNVPAFWRFTLESNGDMQLQSSDDGVAFNVVETWVFIP